MAATFTASGLIEVWRDAALVSRHRVEREAIESCLRGGPGRYEMRFPVVRVAVTADAPVPTAGVINGAVTL